MIRSWNSNLGQVGCYDWYEQCFSWWPLEPSLTTSGHWKLRYLGQFPMLMGHWSTCEFWCPRSCSWALRVEGYYWWLTGMNCRSWWHVFQNCQLFGISCDLAYPDSFLWSPYVIGQTIIFSCCFFFFFLLSFFSSPNLSGRRLDVYHTLAHGVALVRI